jgi:DNA-binding CsgD family transcriptional regulator
MIPILTNQEKDILWRLANGQNTKEIGADLHLSPKTVEYHRYRAQAKLGNRTMPVAKLTRLIISAGLEI